MIEVLLEAVRLKAVPRTGWVRRGVPDAESVAGHAWGVAWLVLVTLPAELNRERALTYALLHDLAEVRTGDLTPADGVPPAAKHAAEHAAMAALTAGLPNGAPLLAAWEAYERQADEESRFVRQLDRLDMALQAARYAQDHGLDPAEFFDSAAMVVTHPALVALLEAARRA